MLLPEILHETSERLRKTLIGIKRPEIHDVNRWLTSKAKILSHAFSFQKVSPQKCRSGHAKVKICMISR